MGTPPIDDDLGGFADDILAAVGRGGADGNARAARIATVEAENARLRARVAELEAENRQLRAERSAVFAVQRNAAIKAERATALAATFAWASDHDRGKADHEGFVRLPLPRLAENAGVSPQRASAHLEHLASWGILQKKTEAAIVHVPDPEGGEGRPVVQQQVWVKLNAPVPETLDRLASLDPKPARTWGGDRPRCPDHPHAGVTKQWVCVECGQIIREEAIAPDEPPINQDDGKVNGHHTGAAPFNQDDAPHCVEGTKSVQLDLSVDELAGHRARLGHRPTGPAPVAPSPLRRVLPDDWLRDHWQELDDGDAPPRKARTYTDPRTGRRFAIRATSLRADAVPTFPDEPAVEGDEPGSDGPDFEEGVI